MILKTYSGKILKTHSGKALYIDPYKVCGPMTLRFWFEDNSIVASTDVSHSTDSYFTKVNNHPLGNVWDWTCNDTNWYRGQQQKVSWGEGLGKIHVIGYGDTSTVTNMSYLFFGCPLVSTVAFDTSGITEAQCMFAHCDYLKTIPLFNTKKLKYLEGMFYDCPSLISIPLLDTSSADDMNRMFVNCTSLTTIPLLDTTNVTSMEEMFIGCTSLDYVPNLSVPKVKDVSSMFYGCANIRTGMLNIYNQAKNTVYSVASAYRGFAKGAGVNTAEGLAERTHIPDSWK